jgi:acylphosphatase
MPEQILQKCYQIRVSGRVQGVGFRYHSRNKAIDLRISGYVRNEADGSVYIEAQGNFEELNEFISWCHQGPRFARVDEVVVSELELKNYNDFHVR